MSVLRSPVLGSRNETAERNGTRTRAMTEKAMIDDLRAEIEKMRADQQRQQMESARKEKELLDALKNSRDALERAETNRTEGGGSGRSSTHSETDSTAQIAAALTMLSTVLSNQSQANAGLQSVIRTNEVARIPSFNLSAVIRDFNGTEDAEFGRAWIEELENVKNINNWSDVAAFSVGKAHLKNSALKWFMTNAENITNFEQFKTSFKAAFTYARSKSEKLKMMAARTQRAQENVQEYIVDKLWLCKGLEFTVDEMRDEIAAGLWSREMANYILSKEFNNTEALMQDLMRFERINLGRRERIVAKRGPSGGTINHRAFTTEEATSRRSGKEGDQQAPKEQGGNVSEFKCYRCNKNGHIARNCTRERKEIVCFVCKKPGHIASRCNNRDVKIEEITVVNGQNGKGSGEKFIRDVNIGESTLKAQIDMGASVCTIKATVVLREGFSMQKKITKLEGFGSNIVASPGAISEMISFENLKPKKIEFMVVPDTAQVYDIILGRPFTESLDLSYTRFGEKLTFSEVDPSLFSDYGQHKVAVKSLADATLEPGEVKFINVQTTEGELELPFVNMNDTSARIKPGDRVGEKILDIRKAPIIKARKEPICVEEIWTENFITDEQKKQLVGILNDYRECIAKETSELGCTDKIEMDIEVNERAYPVQSKPYRLNSKDREELDKIVTDYKKAGIVKETESPYASPAFLVRKKDGSARMVIDYRKLNKITKPINYPIPNFDDLLEKLNGANIFITLDLACGYLQVPLTEKAKEKTAFITETQTGQFERAMFGLFNAPKYFAKLMDKVLGIARKEGIAFSFFDDTCIYAENWNDLVQNLITVLELLREAKLTLNLKKCKFGMKEVEYLGYVLGNGEIRPGDRKILAIEQFPTPKSVHDVRRFIGLASFFRRFIPEFAKIVSPITDLLRTSNKFEWKSEQTKAFGEVKEKLVSKPTLKVFNPKAVITELHTDASAVGLGAMLLQADKENEPLRMVYAISKKTTEDESKYHSSKLELAAVAWALRRLRSFLIGINFRIITDCNCLVNMNAWKTQNAQIARWVSEISEYDFEIRHRKGELMKHVDALSRAPVDDNKIIAQNNEKVFNIETHEDEILMFQRKDAELNELIEILQKNESDRSKQEKERVKEYVIRDNVLYKKCVKGKQEKELYAVPKAMRKSIVIRYHDLCSHFGIDKTVAKIEKYFYFPKLRRYVRIHIKNCLECIIAKTKSGKKEGELNPIPAGRRPFEIVHIDHLGPFITTPRKNKYVLGIIDNLTKYVALYPVINTNQVVTANKVENFIERFGAPYRFITDRGTCFTGKSFQALCEKYGIKHTLNSSRHPQANGLIERMNQTIVPALRMSVNEDQNNWDICLKKIERDVNATISKSTGTTPFEALYGYLPRFDEGKLREITMINENYRLPNEIQQEIRENIEEAQNKYKNNYDKNKRKAIKYNIGDIVFVKRNVTATGESTKLQALFTGPMVVIGVEPSDTYRIKKLNKSRKSNYETTAHASQMKLWTGMNKLSEDESDTDSDDSVE